MPDTAFVTQAFGLRWRSDWPNPWFADAPDDGRAIDVEIWRRAALEPRPGGRRINQGELFADGTRFRLDGAVIDMYDGRRIEWFADRHDEVPLAVCGTVAAHVLAWRGLVPLHGSAVAFDGRAILVAGESGAGKSTLAQALVECGGHLVSDDLSVLLPCKTGGEPLLIPGRPAIRLVERIGDDKEKPKRLALPSRVDADRPVPLAMLVLLRDESIGTNASARTAALSAQIFRPKWMRFLPHWRLRTETMFQAAQRIHFATMPPASSARDVAPAARAAEAVALLRRHLGG
ncbi:MAG: hypothetical protein E7773_08005 [Sphingomonas sp.]|uniref:hypothetical protein n=1 Tax=Sphingomonas sp. TaxID=28214 RepID=UPI0012000566|nr:hypothetical protein [Sphingomonas sp.]THD35883.1 MAG: hypothetical protein E7773_08005 [Sphingomonas sp.]